jgi:hypothetical protein
VKIKIKKQYEELSKDELLDKLVDKILELNKLKKEKEKLEKELKKYKNANTPSSQKKFTKVQPQGLNVGRKKGKKTKHKEKTRAKRLVEPFRTDVKNFLLEKCEFSIGGFTY